MYHQGSFISVMERALFIKCLFWKANVSIVKVMISIASDVLCDIDLAIEIY